MLLRRHTVLTIFSVLVVLTVAWRQPAAFAAPAGPGGVTGVVFLDTNGDGIRNFNEPGFSGIVVTLFGKRSDGSSLYLATRTDSEGRFAFAGAQIGRGSSFSVSTGGAPLAATIPMTYHPQRTFYTATDGNDRNPGDRQQPFRTIQKAVSLLAAGDLLYIRQGEYPECISSEKTPLAGGSGWDRPIVVAGMPGETVVVRPPDREGGEPLINLISQRQQYLVFDNLVLDAANVTFPLRSQSRDGKGPPSHVRLINCELCGANGSAVIVAGEEHQLVNCRIHDNGHAKKDHGLIVSGGHNLIQGCDIYHNAGWGIYVYSSGAETASNNVIRGNRIHNNGSSDSGGFGIGIHGGRKNLLYDNVIWGNNFGIIVSNPGDEAPTANAAPGDDRRPSQESIFNNTIYGNRGPGIAIGSDRETGTNVVRNNIALGNRDPNLDNLSKPTVCDHNMIQGDARFRDPKANDFHLRPGSAAIDAGATIADVRSDHDGIPRPQGKGYDIGAYEYSDDSFVPTTGTFSDVFVPGRTYRVLIGFTKKAK